MAERHRKNKTRRPSRIENAAQLVGANPAMVRTVRMIDAAGDPALRKAMEDKELPLA